MSIDVMKQALDALENHTAIKHPQQRAYRNEAIDALRAAIEQAQQPVAWVMELPNGTRQPLYTAPQEFTCSTGLCYYKDMVPLQAITDPENQPSQYGTVTVEYMKQQIKEALEARENKHENP